jgi:hypothetical protein
VKTYFILALRPSAMATVRASVFACIRWKVISNDVERTNYIENNMLFQNIVFARRSSNTLCVSKPVSLRPERVLRINKF